MKPHEITLLTLGILAFLFIAFFVVNWLRSEIAYKEMANKEWLKGMAGQDEQEKENRS